MNNFIDSHAHIYLDQFDKDREEMLLRCHEVGVNKIFMPNIDHTSIDSMLEVENKYPDQCFSMMGLHPCSVKKDFEKELYRVEEWLNKREFTAVGEIGTDLYWDKTYWEQQQEAFNIQVSWAKEKGLPIVIHCRDSIDETIELVSKLNDEKLTGIFHCFTGSVEQAKKILDLGFYIGLGGVSTFKNGGLDTVIPEIPLDRIVLETDSPYLAPVPYRGKRNEPSYIPDIAKKVATYLHMGLDEIAEKTTANSLALFKL